MDHRTLAPIVAGVIAFGLTLIALPPVALSQSEANPLLESSDQDRSDGRSMEASGQIASREVTISTQETPPPRTRGRDDMSTDSESVENDKGAFFRIAVGAGYSRDQTLEFNDNYAIVNGAYLDIELAPGFKIDAYKAVHLWLHWQYPSINERGNFEPNSGEPLSVVDLGIGYTRQSEDCPLFIGFNTGVSLAFVDSITDGLRADEVGSPGVGAAAEIMVGPMFPVSESLSMGFAVVGGARLIFTGDETFNGYYGGARLLLAIH